MNKKNEKYQFNIIDFIIIIAVIAVIVFISNILVSNFFNNEKIYAEYTLEIKNVRKEDVEQLKIGDKLYSVTEGNSVGSIKEIKISPQESVIFNRSSDRFVTTIDDDRCTLTIIMKTECSYKDNMYLVGNTHLSANTFPLLSIPFEFSECEITNVYTVKTSEDK